jgi:uncharacterized membrane protein
VSQVGSRFPLVTSRAVASLMLLVVDLGALVFAFANLHGPVRLVLGLVLGAVVPGWSVVGLLKLGNVALEVGLTVAVSLALLMVAAQVLLAAHAWHLVVLQEVTGLVCLPPLAWQFLRPLEAPDLTR